MAKDNNNGLKTDKTSESNELTEKKINNINVHIENNSKNSYLNAINAPNYDNLKGMDFSKNKEQSKLKKTKILTFSIINPK